MCAVLPQGFPESFGVKVLDTQLADQARGALASQYRKSVKIESPKMPSIL